MRVKDASLESNNRSRLVSEMIKDATLGAPLFWAWNIVFVAFAVLGFAPVALVDIVRDLQEANVTLPFVAWGVAFVLIPIGGGRSSMRRDMHRVTTTSTASVGSTTYPALVIEGPSLGEPLWVVFNERWVNMDNELDAAVAFVNRG